MAKVSVIGLGKIGLPLALLLAKASHQVTGIDNNPSLLSIIREKRFSGTELSKQNILIKQYLNKNFFVTKELGEISNSEVIFIAIGTSVGEDGTPDLSNLFNLVDSMCKDPSNIKGKVLVIKSTVPIGTTRKIAHLIEEKTNLSCGPDFTVVFCPERVLGDKALSEMESLPKVIGGIGNDINKAVEVYSSIGGKILPVDRPEFAEMVKLLDNAYRQTLFAFANDFALLAEQFGMNAFEIIKVANDSYPRNNIPTPSGGVSGYCLTKDPIYLESSFKEIASKRGFSSVWFNARKTNDYMPVHMIDLLKQNVDVAGKKLTDCNVLVCGVTYKENTDDIRNSHGLEIARKLENEGVNVRIWDPIIQGTITNFASIDNLEEDIKNIDAMLFTVKHNEFLQLNHNGGILKLIENMRTPIVIDGQGVFQNLIGRQDVLYSSVGIK